MIFILEKKRYPGETAVQVVRDLEKVTAGYSQKDGSIRDFLMWSLEQMADRIPLRELDVSQSLDDETISFNYLCLLDSYQIGTFFELSDAPPDFDENQTSGANPG